mgnify:CR=1 FL=1
MEMTTDSAEDIVDVGLESDAVEGDELGDAAKGGSECTFNPITGMTSCKST